jgi:ribosomal protein S12 methylthiotransferase
MKGPKVGIVNLGCPKNTVDSEKFLGLLEREGFEPSSPNEASIVLINTCGFIEPALFEAIEEVEIFIEKKRKGEIDFLGVGGCMIKRDSELLKNYDIDLLFEPEDFDRVLRVLKNRFFKNSVKVLERRYPLIPRSSLTSSHYAYLKIAEGCERRCTFCTIPLIRGKLRSYPVEELVEEARRLALRGVKEIILIAQDITLYGYDLYGRQELSRLIKGIERIDGIEWIRLLYIHPAGLDRKLLDFIRASEKVIPYFEVPIQHISERILRKMGRDGGRRAVEKAIEGLRNAKPEAFIRTEIIVGFPGEKEEEFEELLKFLDDMEIERIGLFPFYKEKGTKASLFKDEIDENLVREREERASLVVDTLIERAQKRLIGKKVMGIIDSPDEKMGRTVYDAPQIDLNVVVEGEVRGGEIVELKIKGLSCLNLVGEVLEH